MRVIKGLQNTYNIFHDLCRGTDDSLLILYGWTEPIKSGVAVIHRDRSDETYEDINKLEQEITAILDEIKNWTIFQFKNIFLHGNFDENEIRILNRIDARFQEYFKLNITVQVWDKEMEGKFIIKEV